MRKVLRRLFKKTDGQALVVFVLMISILGGFAALAIDVGAMQVEKRSLQNMADAAALAGAQDLSKGGNAAENTAVEFARLNGLNVTHNNTENDGNLIIAKSSYNGDSTKLEVKVKSKVNHTFARLIGFNNSDVSARAVAQSTSSKVGGPFEFALFSGDPNAALELGNISISVTGSIHSNQNLTFKNLSSSISGSVQAVSDVRVESATVSIGGNLQGNRIFAPTWSVSQSTKRIEEAAPFIEMPDFSEMIKQEAQAAGQVYTGNTVFQNTSKSVNAPIYVDGDLTVKNASFTGQGIVLVTGDIILEHVSYQSSNAPVAFYSRDGNITIQHASASMHGILYAPKGKVTYKHVSTVVHGRVVAKQINFSNASVSIIASDKDLEVLPNLGGNGSKLTE